MTRESRIRHPAGAKFIKIHQWVVVALGGHCEAATLAIIEFRDRINDSAGEWLGLSANDIVKSLAGLFGRDKVLKSILAIEERGWIDRKTETKLVGQLWQKRSYIRLCPAKINAWIEENIIKTEDCDFSTHEESENRGAGGDFSTSRGRFFNNKSNEGSTLTKEAAAKEMDAAAASSKKTSNPTRPQGAGDAAKVKNFQAVRGVICWTESDRQLVAALADRHGLEIFDKAVLAAEVKKGGAGPLPSAVAKAIVSAARQAEDAGAKQAAEEKAAAEGRAAEARGEARARWIESSTADARAALSPLVHTASGRRDWDTVREKWTSTAALPSSVPIRSALFAAIDAAIAATNTL